MSIAPRYYDQKDVYPFLDVLSDNIDIIQREIAQQVSWIDWPERNLYPSNKKDNPPFIWRVYPIFGFDTWVRAASLECPETFKLLKRIPGLKTAVFSVLGPKSAIVPHHGWSDLANYVLRCHLGIFVPDMESNLGSSQCGIWVEGETREQKMGEWIIFDDSKLHSGYNNSDQYRMVLLLDIERPLHIPLGQSLYHITDERDRFVEFFKNVKTT